MMEPNTPDFLSRTERRKILQEFDLNPLRNKGGICVINSTLQCILASKVLIAFRVQAFGVFSTYTLFFCVGSL